MARNFARRKKLKMAYILEQREYLQTVTRRIHWAGAALGWRCARLRVGARAGPREQSGCWPSDTGACAVRAGPRPSGAARPGEGTESARGWLRTCWLLGQGSGLNWLGKEGKGKMSFCYLLTFSFLYLFSFFQLNLYTRMIHESNRCTLKATRPTKITVLQHDATTIIPLRFC
jgi:hypothetical protein